MINAREKTSAKTVSIGTGEKGIKMQMTNIVGGGRNWSNLLGIVCVFRCVCFGGVEQGSLVALRLWRFFDADVWFPLFSSFDLLAPLQSVDPAP